MQEQQTRVPRCPMCASPNRIHMVAKQGAAYVECDDCDTIYADPRPSDGALLDWLNHYAATEGDASAGWNESVAAESWKLDLVNGYARGGSKLLDVGSGTGAFVAAARAAGHDSEGQDLAESVARKAERTLGVKIHSGPLKSVTDSYDIVTLWDTLEHCVSPPDELAECARLLRKNGTLFILSPHAHGLSGRVFRGGWWVFGPVEHLVMFSPRALRSSLAQAGFKVIHLETRRLAPPVPPQESANLNYSMRAYQRISSSRILMRLIKLVGLGDWIFVVAHKV